MSKGRPNLDQVRARNAMMAIAGGVRGRGVQNGDAISGFPALVIQNGLLATMAFSISKKGKGGYGEICDAVAVHLADGDINLIPKASASMTGLRDFLASSDSTQLRLCTAETLVYLNYLRRFAKGEAKERKAED